MAQRRMFSKEITNSSEFLMMSQSAQNLYFHIGMNADDDGFCEVFTIMRMTESKPDDLQSLHIKGFVFVVNSKVCIVKDWHENNQLRIDRYKQSNYFKDENVKEVYLEIMHEKIAKISQYKEMLTKWQPVVAKMAPQVRIGKVRVGKKRKGEEKEAPSAPCLPDPGQDESSQQDEIVKNSVGPVGENSIGDYVIPYDLSARNDSTPDYEKVETIIDIFRTRDPNMEKAYGNKFYRAAILTLVKQYGFEKIKNLTILAVKLQSEKYAPKIYNPINLRDNMVKLRSYIETELKDQSNIISG